MENSTKRIFNISEKEYLGIRAVLRLISHIKFTQDAQFYLKPKFINDEDRKSLHRRYDNMSAAFVGHPEVAAKVITMLTDEFWLDKHTREFIIGRYGTLRVITTFNTLKSILVVMDTIEKFAQQYVQVLEPYEQMVINYIDNDVQPEIQLDDLEIKSGVKLKKLYKNEDDHWLGKLQKMRDFTNVYGDITNIINRLIKFPGETLPVEE